MKPRKGTKRNPHGCKPAVQEMAGNAKRVPVKVWTRQTKWFWSTAVIVAH